MSKSKYTWYRCIKTFTVSGKTLLDKIEIKEGDIFILHSLTDSRAILYSCAHSDYHLIICREYFNNYFVEMEDDTDVESSESMDIQK